MYYVEQRLVPRMQLAAPCKTKGKRKNQVVARILCSPEHSYLSDLHELRQQNPVIRAETEYKV